LAKVQYNGLRLMEAVAIEPSGEIFYLNTLDEAAANQAIQLEESHWKSLRAAFAAELPVYKRREVTLVLRVRKGFLESHSLGAKDSEEVLWSFPAEFLEKEADVLKFTVRKGISTLKFERVI
jgi:hypothetical protein